MSDEEQVRAMVEEPSDGSDRADRPDGSGRARARGAGPQAPAAAAAAVAAEAGIRMLNPARCLDQLSRHAEHLRDRSVGLRAHAHADAPSVQAVERSGAGVTLVLDDGRCLLRVDEGVLSVRVEAADEAGLRRIQHVIGADVARFGAREALEVTWRFLGRTCEG